MDDVHRLCPHRGELRGTSSGSGSTSATAGPAVQVGEQHRALISSLLTLIDGGDSNRNNGVFLIGTVVPILDLFNLKYGVSLVNLVLYW